MLKPIRKSSALSLGVAGFISLASCSAALPPIGSPSANQPGLAQTPGMDRISRCQAEANRTWRVSDAVAVGGLSSENGASNVQAEGHKGTCTINSAGLARVKSD